MIRCLWCNLACFPARTGLAWSAKVGPRLFRWDLQQRGPSRSGRKRGGLWKKSGCIAFPQIYIICPKKECNRETSTEISIKMFVKCLRIRRGSDSTVLDRTQLDPPQACCKHCSTPFRNRWACDSVPCRALLLLSHRWGWGWGWGGGSGEGSFSGGVCDPWSVRLNRWAKNAALCGL